MPKAKTDKKETIRKQKISETCKKSGVGKWMKGRRMPDKQVDELRERMIGNKIMLGRKLSKDTKLKMSRVAKERGTGKWMSEKIGEKGNNWQGGLSFKPYSIDWTKTLRIAIRERDNYICQICEEKQGDKIHHVHHIDYDKQNCNSDNLITLCISCHIKTNSNREYWTNCFQINNK